MGLWEIADDETFTTPITYTGQDLDTTYNGWYLRLWASNEDGIVYSNAVLISIHDSNANTITVMSCEHYIWNGQIYNESGVYQEILINQWGCDSITTLYLGIGHDIVNNLAVNTCDSYHWNGTTYTESGMQGEAVILIYDYLGQLIGRFSVDTAIEGTIVPYTLMGKAAGVYYIRVFNNSVTTTKKIIKDKPATYGINNW